jgi:hypothetical protein
VTRSCIPSLTPVRPPETLRYRQKLLVGSAREPGGGLQHGVQGCFVSSAVVMLVLLCHSGERHACAVAFLFFAINRSIKFDT